MWFRLRENHPTTAALQEVFKKMDEVGIAIELGAYGRLYVRHKGGPRIDLIDNEAACAGDRDSIGQLPPHFEYKLVYEKEGERECTNAGRTP